MSKPPSILMIDDHKPNLTALEATLDGLGAELVFAQSGEEALDILLQQDPDEFALILLLGSFIAVLGIEITCPHPL